jgi:hypothetical protein
MTAEKMIIFKRQRRSPLRDASGWRVDESHPQPTSEPVDLAGLTRRVTAR